ncbi:Glycerol-3-phosphate acyltransferase 1 [Platanthera guangdongensis]|uniref:Glycerol-3-phosphate acyltransferase 1 n=1 Tax=Platanthera guangdongensis TaxID=2320717 RepID=A0ABR2M5J3_9ASPA
MEILKIAVHECVSYFFKAAKQIHILHSFVNRIPPPSSLHPLPSLSLYDTEAARKKKAEYSVLFDFHGSLLRSSSLFPFFMVVAFEGGGLFRAALLLLTFPLLLLAGHGGELMGLKMMAFVTFCGLRRRNVEIVARAVLNKVYLEDLNRRGYEVVEAAAAGRKVAVTSLPRVMVEGFLKEYVGVSEVIAAEMEVRGMYFTGIFAAGGGGGGGRCERQMALWELLGEDKADIGLVNTCSTPTNQMLISFSKLKSLRERFLCNLSYVEIVTDSSNEISQEVYIVNKKETPVITPTNADPLPAGKSTLNPKPKYPKPLVFHDGRLAFLPTPSATLAVLLFLPFSLILSILRILTGLVFPYWIAITVASALGLRIRVSHPPNPNPNPNSRKADRGVLYVCNHRTLADPIILSVVLARSVPAVTYSLSPISEAVSPIPTVRLTRDRRRDAAIIRRIIAAGNLAICPEGTTCREPYLLRFSPLFAELADEIEPVAINVEVSMFYGTTASGIKSLDPIFFFMNPRPWYYVGLLGRVSPKMIISGGFTAADVANGIQRKLAEALGFQCTTLTRRDKYLMLAGNDGIVTPEPPKEA